MSEKGKHFVFIFVGSLILGLQVKEGEKAWYKTEFGDPWSGTATENMDENVVLLSVLGVFAIGSSLCFLRTREQMIKGLIQE